MSENNEKNTQNKLDKNSTIRFITQHEIKKADYLLAKYKNNSAKCKKDKK